MAPAAGQMASVDGPPVAPPSGCLSCPLAGSAAADPQPGVAAAALLCFGLPLALLLLGAGLVAAFAAGRPWLALLGLALLPALGMAAGIGARQRIESWLAPDGGVGPNIAQQGISK